MNICFSYDHLYPASSRAGRHIETLARRFTSRGHRVFAITTPVENAQEPEGVAILRLREAPGAKGHNRQDALQQKAIQRFLRQNDVQVLFAEGITPLSAIAAKSAKRAGARTIVRVLADASGIVYSIGHEKKVPPSVLKKRLAAMLEDADATAASSERCAQLLREYYDGEIVVIEKCVDLSVFRHTRVTERDLETFRDRFGLAKRPVIVYGREEMRAETILSTISLVRQLVEKKPEIVYLVCGHIDDAEAVKTGIERAGLSDNYRLVGSLGQRETFAAYAAANFYLAPYDSRASESEILEAMAMRCAIVCSAPKAASAPGIIQPDWNALVFDTHDEAGAAARIASLLESPEDLRALRDHALETARTKDISTAVEHVEQLCDRMLGLPMVERPADGGDDADDADTAEAPKAQEKAPQAAVESRGSEGDSPVRDDDDQNDDLPADFDDFGADNDLDDDEDAAIDAEGADDDLDESNEDDARALAAESLHEGGHAHDHDDIEGEGDVRDADFDGEADDAGDEGAGDQDAEAPAAGSPHGEAFGERRGRRGRRRRGRGRLRHEDGEPGEGENVPADQAAEDFADSDGEDMGDGAPGVDDIDDVPAVAAVGTAVLEAKPNEEELLAEASKRLRDLDPKLTLKDLMPFLRPPKDVYVMSLASASGHHRAGEAIFEAFKAMDQNLRVRQINILDHISRSFTPAEVDRRLEEIYQSPSIFGSLFETGPTPPKEAAKDAGAESPEAARAAFFAGIFGEKMKQFILDKRPDQVVLTHFLPLKTIADLKREHSLRMRITVVVTDYDFHPYWIAEGVDQYLCPTEKVRYKMIRAGAPAQIVEVSGVPVHPRFEADVDLENVRRQLGIRSNIPTIMLRPGGIGPTETILDVIRQISNVGQPFNLLVLAGKNEALQEAIRSMNPPRGVSVKAFGFVNNIHEIMAASDLMITRATGHTVAEAFATGLPMVLLRPTPGVEDRTADWFVERGVAIKSHDSLDLEWTMSDLLKNGARALKSMREAAAAGGRPRTGAAHLAVERIGRQLH